MRRFENVGFMCNFSSIPSTNSNRPRILSYRKMRPRPFSFSLSCFWGLLLTSLMCRKYISNVEKNVNAEVLGCACLGVFLGGRGRASFRFSKKSVVLIKQKSHSCGQFGCSDLAPSGSNHPQSLGGEGRRGDCRVPSMPLHAN